MKLMETWYTCYFGENTFELGTIVLHRQLQVSTGKGSDYKPKFTGPYSIIKLNEDNSCLLYTSDAADE